MPENASEHFNLLEAMAGTTAAATSGVMALTIELVRAGSITPEAGQRVAESMVRSKERNAGRASRDGIADAIGTAFALMAAAAE
jgi:polyhydroxyalkanoate synthesis regulator phasin